MGDAAGRADVHRPAAAQGAAGQAASCSPSSARSTPTAPSPTLGRRCWRCRSIPASARMVVAEPSRARLRRRRHRRRARRAARRDRRAARPTSPSASRVVGGHGGHERADRGAVDRVRERAADLARRPASRFDVELGRCRPRRRRAARSRYPDRLAGAPPPRPVPAPLRRRRPGCRSDDPLAHERVRRRRRPRRPARPVTDPARRRARRRRGGAASWPTRSSETVSLSGTPSATTSSSASSAGSDAMRLGESVRPAHRGADATTRTARARVAATGLAVLGWNAGLAALRRPRRVPPRTPSATPWPDWSAETLTRTARRVAGAATSPRPPVVTTSSGSTSSRCCGRSCRGRTGPARRAGAPGVDAAHRPRRADRLLGRRARRRACGCRTCSARPSHPTAGGRPIVLAPAVTRRSADPGHRRSARLLVGQLGRGPQGARRPLPEASVADRPRPRATEATERSVTPPLRFGGVAVGSS